MTSETQVYFPLTGTESRGFVRVRLYRENGAARAAATVAGPMTEAEDFADMPAAGDPHEVLREARARAELRGLDLRVELDGVEWDPALGSLVG